MWNSMYRFLIIAFSSTFEYISILRTLTKLFRERNKSGTKDSCDKKTYKTNRTGMRLID